MEFSDSINANHNINLKLIEINEIILHMKHNCIEMEEEQGHWLDGIEWDSELKQKLIYMKLIF